MSCETTKDIQRLFSSGLTDEERSQLVEHLAECPECRRESELLAAVRLALPAKPASSTCLSDESLALLYDGALEGDEYRQALSHMADCDRCLGAWLALDRALSEAEARPAPAPAGLVARAAGSQTSSWLDRLFSGKMLARLALAASAAAAVFALVITLSPEPAEPPEYAPGAGHGPVLLPEGRTHPLASSGEAPDGGSAKGPAVPATVPGGGVGDTTVAAGGAGHAAAGGREAAPTAGTTGGSFSEGLDAKTTQALVASLGRFWTGQASIASAFESGVGSALARGYLAGRAAETLGVLSGQQDDAGARALTAVILQSLARQFKLSHAADAARLAAFAADLGGKIAARKIAASSAGNRLKVLAAALAERSSAEKPYRAGFELGKLTGSLAALSALQLNGRAPPQEVWPSKERIANIRKLIEHTKALDPAARGAFEKLGRTVGASRGSDRSARILEDIEQIDHNIRASRY